MLNPSSRQADNQFCMEELVSTDLRVTTENDMDGITLAILIATCLMAGLILLSLVAQQAERHQQLLTQFEESLVKELEDQKTQPEPEIEPEDDLDSDVELEPIAAEHQ